MYIYIYIYICIYIYIYILSLIYICILSLADELATLALQRGRLVNFRDVNVKGG